MNPTFSWAMPQKSNPLHKILKKLKYFKTQFLENPFAQSMTIHMFLTYHGYKNGFEIGCILFFMKIKFLKVLWGKDNFDFCGIA